MVEKALAIIDVGGTKTMCALYSLNLDVLSRIEVSSDVSTQQAEIAIIKKLIDSAMDSKKFEITAIGIDSVGKINPEKGIWYGINKKIAKTVELSKMLQQIYDVPCFMLNDVYAATYAENRLGLGKKTGNFIYINIGTGIAGRIVVDGQIINGNSDYAGEFGHTVVDMAAKTSCTCGLHGCVESFASGLGISNMAVLAIRDGKKSILKIESNGRISVQNMIKEYDRDDLARKVIDKAVDGLVALIASLIRIDDPAGVVLGGGVINNDKIFEMILKRLDELNVSRVQYGVTRTKLQPSLIASLGMAAYTSDQIN